MVLMNVEQLQKINQLATELKKHNLSINTEEAVQQAEETYGHGQQAAERQPIQETVSQRAPDLLEQRRFEILLQNHTRRYEEQFEIYRNAINKLAEELEIVKTKLTALTANQPKERQESLPQTKSEVKKEPHPKQGGFSSSDVDIQKMFYFGNKH